MLSFDSFDHPPQIGDALLMCAGALSISGLNGRQFSDPPPEEVTQYNQPTSVP